MGIKTDSGTYALIYELALITAIFGLDWIGLDWVSKNGSMSNSDVGYIGHV